MGLPDSGSDGLEKKLLNVSSLSFSRGGSQPGCVRTASKSYLNVTEQRFRFLTSYFTFFQW